MVRIPVSGRRRTRQKGNTLLELGLCFTAFLLLTFGAMDFAMCVYSYNFCYYSARVASRWVSVRGTTIATASNCTGDPGMAAGCAANQADVASKVSSMAVGLDPTKITVTATWVPGHSPGNEANVTVAYLVTPLTGLGLTNGLTVSSSSQMEMVH
jgi:Flp pilus assembly protein TadG